MILCLMNKCLREDINILKKKKSYMRRRELFPECARNMQNVTPLIAQLLGIISTYNIVV